MTPQRPNVGIPDGSPKLTPDWIAGFVDGEGCFYVGVNKHPEVKFGYQILPELKVGTEIYINNKEHKFNLEQGKVIGKDHRHYKVELIHLGKVIWVPEHWVEPLPEELKCTRITRQ